MTAPNDTTTALNPGTGGDSMDESLVTQSNGTTAAKRPRVVVGSDDGELYGRMPGGSANPFPVQDQSARRAGERAQLVNLSRLDVNLTTRHAERVRRGDRLDLIDSRGPGGR